MANTTWNSSDKSNVTLSNVNLTATSTGSGGGVRAVDKQNTGQYYFEVTVSTWANGQTGTGIANGLAVLGTTSGTVWTNACAVQKTGVIYMNGAGAPGNPTLGALAAGNIIGIAVDLINGLVWFRVGPSGNWNGNATYAPSGTGGVSISSLGGGGLGIFPLFAFVGAGDVATANFGNTAFSGAVPSGFTFGWPTSSLATNALVTQTAVEQFITVNPLAQVTQVSLEQWATTVTITGQALVTQVALEQWALVDLSSSNVQARVMVMA